MVKKNQKNTGRHKDTHSSAYCPIIWTQADPNRVVEVERLNVVFGINYINQGSVLLSANPQNAVKKKRCLYSPIFQGLL